VSPTVVGTYELELSVQDDVSGSSDRMFVTVNPNNVANRAPIASAGPNAEIPRDSRSNLDASASYDPDGDTISFSWRQVSGPNTMYMENRNSANPTIIPITNGVYVFEVTVTDNLLSSTDQVTITVVDRNTLPTIVVNTPISRRTNQLVTLDASQSYDTNSDPITFEWQQLTGTSVLLSNENGAITSFTAPSQPDSLTFLIKVSDGHGISSKVVVVNIVQNQLPVLTIDDGFFVDPYDTVNVISSAYDNDGDSLTFQWNILSQPLGASASLSNANQPVATFHASTKGFYTLEVTVNDGFGSVSATIVIIANTRPNSNAGFDINREVNTQIQLDGTQSSDNDIHCLGAAPHPRGLADCFSRRKNCPNGKRRRGVLACGFRYCPRDTILLSAR